MWHRLEVIDINHHFFSYNGKPYIFDSNEIKVHSVGHHNSVSSERRITSEDRPLIDNSIEFLVNASQDCNMACTYCFTDGGQFGYGDDRVTMLSPAHSRLLVEILPEAFPNARHYNIHFYGGEPMLNLPAIKAAVETALVLDPIRFYFTVTTNGTICTEEAITLLRDGSFNVILSIDGPREIHDKYRRTVTGEPTHHKVLEFLERIKEENLYVRGSSVIHRGWPLGKACDYLKSLGVDCIKAQAVRLPEGNPIALTEDEYIQYYADLENIANEVINKIRQNKHPIDDRYNNRVLQLVLGRGRSSYCGAGQHTFGLAADGTVLPCALLAGKPETNLGHIEEPYKKWLTNGEIWSRDQPVKPSCDGCWAYPLCGGGCPAMMSVCGEKECELVKSNCEMALKIYAAYIDNPSNLLLLSGVKGI